MRLLRPNSSSVPSRPLGSRGRVFTRALIIVVMLTGLVTACDPVTPYAAKVNGVIIKSSQIDAEVHAITSNSRYAEALDQELASVGGLRPGGGNTINAQYMSSLVYDRVLSVLIHNELVKQGLTVTPDERSKVEQALRTQGNDPMLFDSLAEGYRDYIVGVQAELQKVLDARSSPEAQRRYYDNNTAKFNQTCFRQLSIVDPSKVETFRSRLAAGEDFNVLANEAATDAANASGAPPSPPDTAPKCVTDQDLSDFARTTLAALQVNQVSEPLQGQNGIAIVQVVSRKQLGFEEAQPAIRDALSKRETFFDEALGNANIKVNPRYGDFHPADATTGQPAGVVPHQGVSLSETPLNTTGSNLLGGADSSPAGQ